ncbi:MAG: NAD+ synthase [Nitrospirae bacterium]|nr:NAD+ synthase [Nitrospirota bacterium]
MRKEKGKKIRIALAQINSTVGDLEGNMRKIEDYIKEAKKAECHIVAFPELAITGYPPEDLILKPQFIKDNLEALKEVKRNTSGITAIVGFVDKKSDSTSKDGASIYNAAAIIHDRRLIDIYHKILLPNYGVFDEFRYFKAGKKYPVYTIDDIVIGVNICEDIWFPVGPTRFQAHAGAKLIININGSPYYAGKRLLREKMLLNRAKENKVVIAYVNLVGGQDELVFDGQSIIVNEKGEIVLRGKAFEEELLFYDINIPEKNVKTGGKRKAEKIVITNKRLSIPVPQIPEREIKPLSEMEEIFRALVLGTKDYIEKNGFIKVIISLSGGVDSSLVATIAVDAIGRENVMGLFLPSLYTSKESREDTYELVRNLGIKLIEVPITEIFEQYLKTLPREFKDMPQGVAEENLQARIRGNVLMAFSNKFGWLVLTTGNKSEMSVGYATLYGDMAGGFAVIKDVPKTMVYKLCEYRNKREGNTLIPQRILWKEPSAELKLDQRDSDVLPPYEVLDPILKAYIEDDRSFEEILKMGCDVLCAKNVITMIDNSEYKRRQAPPGIKITPRAFGRDRRFPITNKYRSY